MVYRLFDKRRFAGDGVSSVWDARLKKRIAGKPPPTISRMSSVSYALAEEMRSVSLHGQLILLTQSGDPEADALACLEKDRLGLHAKAHTGRCAG